ncbi:histidinol-phosphate transaminase [Oceanobacillus polygoni]|uniref:Histidinol-phosphate aminotransferase n=1 Tax=Oceanobacillus polygoni TaxID=1235259 RepID=A0A9X1CHD7_9BACI|nr:histidinol-phosphate transaminase [Oceanobacillus polygoni]MBP2077863.1 histidinol-phosphate aminotransferase [Oceanobacillus polygoni]
MEAKSILSKLIPYKQGKQTKEIQEEFGLNRIVKLASNENPYGYSDQVKKTLLQALPDFNIYPDGYTAELRTVLAQKLEVEESRLVFGSGTEEIIQMLCRTYLVPGSNVVTPAPTFGQYKHYSLIEGAEVKEIEVTADGYHDLDKMLDAIDEKTRIVWLCSPNNPIGTVIPKESFEAFINRCPKHVLVAFDEAYFEYVDPKANIDVLSFLENHNNLIVMRTFSKAYGLAGLRIGYGIANRTIIEKVNVVRGPFNTTSIAQQAALVALTDQTFIKDTYEKNKAVKATFEKFLKNIGWKYFHSETNFILVETPISGLDVFQYLLERGFIVRPGELLGMPNTIRVSLGTEEDMKELQHVLLELHNEAIEK